MLFTTRSLHLFLQGLARIGPSQRTVTLRKLRGAHCLHSNHGFSLSLAVILNSGFCFPCLEYIGVQIAPRK